MNILVTGGNGQLGCSLRKIAGMYPQHRFVFTDVPEADITDWACIAALAEKHAIDLIVNCAAYTAVDRAESDAETAAKINVQGSEVLAGVARERGIGLIHISTDYVFDGESCHPLKEDRPTAPQGVYGRTKLAGEQAIEASRCNACVIRTAWLYSEYGNNFVKTMLRLGRERDELNVVYDQVGTPTYATDLAHAILRLAERGVSGFEVYHFSDEGAISWYDFAKAVFALAGIDIRVGAIETAAYPTPARRPAYSVLAKDKIREAGVRVPYWLDSLRECMAIVSVPTEK